MRIGIVGSENDPQSVAVSHALRQEGAEPVLIPFDGFERGKPFAFVDSSIQMGSPGLELESLDAVHVRFIPSCYAPAIERDGAWQLHDDWFADYVRTRERASYFVSLLLQLERRGAALVNPLQSFAVIQDKPYQLEVLRAVGARVPRTLITNDPVQVLAFSESLGKPVIYKPLLGGASTRLLDAEARSRLELIRSSPVIFQEAIEGPDLRVVVVGDEVISSVSIETPRQYLDFRDDPVYSSGAASYQEVELPESVKALCVRATRECGLCFSGIDIKRTRENEWVFLELNSSPVYRDVELKLKHPISEALAGYLVARAKATVARRR